MREEKIRRREELRKKNKKKRSIIPLLLTILIASMIAVLSLFYYLTTPVDKSNNNDVKIEIKENYGSSKIAEELYNKGVIRSTTVFKIYSRINSDSSFYVGNFKIKPSMSLSEIMSVLTNKEKAKSSDKAISIIEGDNIEKIAQTVEKNTGISKEQFLDKVNDADFITKLKEKFPELITDDIFGKDIKYALEGYLYPAIYDFENNDTVETLITKMVRLSNEKIVPKFKENNHNWTINNKKVEITIHDYITMASILEKESTQDGDNRKIAGVFLNRLAIGMKLQTDPTANYGVGKTSGVTTITDTQNRSPYNTYIITGLPPGPIASAGVASYDALNNAEDHDYLFFVNATDDGKAYFSKTFAEHEELARKHVKGYGN